MEISKSITTILEKWQLIVWAVISLLIGGLLFLIVSSFAVKLFVGLICVAGSFYLSRYLCRASTTFEFNHGILIICQYCKTLNITEDVQIDVSQIRGFEINEVTRGNRALILYFTNFVHLKLSITKISDELKIKNFLRKELKFIDKNSNPFFKSYVTAFWFALKRNFLFIIISSLLCSSIILPHKTTHLSTFEVMMFVILLSILIWYFIVNKPVKKHYFRFGAFYWLSNFLIYLSPLLLLPIYFTYEDYKEIPFNLENPYQAQEHPPHNLYEFKNVNYNPKIVTVTDYFFGSSTGRSSNQTVHHYFATPVTENQPIVVNGIYVLWLAKHFKQTINKRDENNIKMEQAISYQKNNKNSFIKLFAKKPIFYKAMFKERDAYETIRTSSSAAKSIIVLEPHWESLLEYKNQLKKEMFYFFGGLLLANIIGCLIIAYNR